ncbi:MAG: helix-turn-helix transcriptional regulator [Clostridia bacterium]|nr:helix-turn-helix transcriptional regulator [Clostridia bacterium]
MDYSELATRICALRKQSGMTQKQLAERLSVTDKTVSKWETGYTTPDIEMLDRLCKVFGCTLDELVHGEDETTETPETPTETPTEEAPRREDAPVFASSEPTARRLSKGVIIGVVLAAAACLAVVFICLAVFVWSGPKPVTVGGVNGDVTAVKVDKNARTVSMTATDGVNAFSLSQLQLSSDEDAKVRAYADAAMTKELTNTIHLYEGGNTFYIRITAGEQVVDYTLTVNRIVDAATHTHVSREWTVVTPATCTTDGLRQAVCSDCGKTYTEVVAKGHTPVVDAAVAPTCQHTGLTEGSHCAVCGAVLVEQTELAKIDHAYRVTDGLCEMCGKSRYEIVTSQFDSQILEDASLIVERNADVRRALSFSDGQAVKVAASRMNTSDTLSTGTFAYMQVMAFCPSDYAGDNVPANVFYIGVEVQADATAEQIKTAQKDAAEYLYTLFTQINSGKISENAAIIMPAGTTIDASAHEWAPVKHFAGYFGTDDSEHPVVISGARLTKATGYREAMTFEGTGGKYFVTGFIGAVYGEATIENVRFTKLTVDEPASNFDMTLTTKQHSRNAVGVVGGVIDAPVEATTVTSATNVTLRNITVDNDVTIKGAATAAGLVGYVGGAGANRRLVNGTLTIENCHISADVIGGPETGKYGPCGGIIGHVGRTAEGDGEDVDGDATAGECYDIVIRNTVFDGRVTGYRSVGTAIGDIDSAVVLAFEGVCDFSGAELTSQASISGLVNANAGDGIVYFSTANMLKLATGMRYCGDLDWDGTDVDARSGFAKYDTLTDGQGNFIGGNNGSFATVSAVE